MSRTPSAGHRAALDNHAAVSMWSHHISTGLLCLDQRWATRALPVQIFVSSKFHPSPNTNGSYKTWSGMTLSQTRVVLTCARVCQYILSKFWFSHTELFCIVNHPLVIVHRVRRRSATVNAWSFIYNITLLSWNIVVILINVQFSDVPQPNEVR